MYSNYQYQYLVSCVSRGDKLAAKELIKRHREEYCLLNPKDSQGASLLQRLIRNNEQDIVILLLNNGAEVNTQDKSGNTPLHEAAKNGNKDLVIHLLFKNANVFIKNKEGKTPGSIAARSGFYEVANLFHPAFPNMFRKMPVSFFKSDQCTIKNEGEIEIQITSPLITGVQKFTF